MDLESSLKVGVILPFVKNGKYLFDIAFPAYIFGGSMLQ